LCSRSLFYRIHSSHSQLQPRAESKSVAEHLRNNADTKRNAVATNNTYSEPLPHTMNYHPMAVEKKSKGWRCSSKDLSNNTKKPHASMRGEHSTLLSTRVPRNSPQFTANVARLFGSPSLSLDLCCDVATQFPNWLWIPGGHGLAHLRCKKGASTLVVAARCVYI
jgi:hypothetical protein